MPIDPACGLFVHDGPDVVQAEVRGRRYVFCSPACRRRFTAPERELNWTKRMAAVALGAGVALMAVGSLKPVPEPLLGGFLFALGTAIQALAGWPFYQGLGRALRLRGATTDTLVVLGTTTAWLFGAVEFLAPEALVPGAQLYYFEVSALVLGFLLVGKHLELRLRRQASEEMQRLMELQPRTARVLREGAEVERSMDEVLPGDILVVWPGETIAADGVVAEGSSAVDEKLVTGESLPVDKNPGDKVIGGTVVRGAPLKVEVTAIGGATALSRIVDLIEQAQTSAPPVRRYADKVSAWFVPLVVGIAALAALGWMALGSSVSHAASVAIAVLLIASPSAVGLATPAVLTVGVAKGARRGILLKGAEFLERIQEVDIVIYDKTGTLTQGEPALTDLVPFGHDEAALRQVAASAEVGSAHPLGKTLVRSAQEAGLELDEPRKVTAMAGVGIMAEIGRSEVLVGSKRLLHDRGIDTRHADERLQALQEEGKTVVLVAKDDALVGVVAFADPIRPEAAQAVQQLRAQDIDVALVTGDNVRTARAVGHKLAIKRTFAEITPHGKAGTVKAFQDGGHVVAMVGDGINDAPALAAADVGIAIGSGAEVAVEAADIVLMRSDPRDVPAAIQLGKETYARIKQNLFWAFAYNVALIPLAALALLNPLLAGLAMAFSSLPVVANSLRIAKAWDGEDLARPAGAAPAAVPAAPPRVAPRVRAR